MDGMDGLFGMGFSPGVLRMVCLSIRLPFSAVCYRCYRYFIGTGNGILLFWDGDPMASPALQAIGTCEPTVRDGDGDMALAELSHPTKP